MKRVIAGIAIGIIGIGTIACGSETIVQPSVQPIVQPSIVQPIVQPSITEPQPVVITRAEFETIAPGACDEIAMMGPNFYAKGIAENKILKVASNDTTETMWLYCEELWFLN